MGGLLSLLRGSNKDSELLGKNASDSEVLGGIYKLMVQKENLNRLDYEKRKNYAEEQDIEQARRHAEIVKALTVRRKPAPRKAKAKKPFRLPTLPGRKPVPVPAKPSVPSGPKPGATAPVPSPGAPSGPKPGTPAPVPSPGAPSGPSAGEIARQQAARRAAEETARRQAAETAKETARKEAFRKAEREAENKAKEEVERKAREEAVRKAQEETARRAQEETAKKAREAAEAARIAREAREAAEAAKKAKDAEEAARRAREAAEAAKRAKDAEEAAKRAREAEESARKAREAAEAAKRAREAEESARKAREAAEAARIAREADKRRNDRTTEEEKGVRAANESAKREADRKAREETARKAREELARKEADKRRNDRTTEEEKGVRAAGEAAKREADRRAREESARKSAERVERKPDQPATAQPAPPPARPGQTATPVPRPGTGAPSGGRLFSIGGGLAITSEDLRAIISKHEGNENAVYGDYYERRPKLGKDGKPIVAKNGKYVMERTGRILNEHGDRPQEWSENNLGKRKDLTDFTFAELLQYVKYRTTMISKKEGKKGPYGAVGIAGFMPATIFGYNLDGTSTFNGKTYPAGLWFESGFKWTDKFSLDNQKKFSEINSNGIYKSLQAGLPKIGYTGPITAAMMLQANYLGARGFLAIMDEAQKNPNVTVREAYLRRIKIDPTQGMTANKELATQTVSQFLIAKQIYIKEQIEELNITPQRMQESVSTLSPPLNLDTTPNLRRTDVASQNPAQTVVINQQNTVAGNATQQQNRDVVDDSSPYSRKSRA